VSQHTLKAARNQHHDTIDHANESKLTGLLPFLMSKNPYPLPLIISSAEVQAPLDSIIKPVNEGVDETQGWQMSLQALVVEFCEDTGNGWRRCGCARDVADAITNEHLEAHS
jgi:hypothetical protein